MENVENKVSRNRGQKVKGFFIHLVVSTVVIAGLAALNLTTMRLGGYTYYWFLFPLAGISWGLLWHGLGIFLFMKRDAMRDKAQRAV